MTIRKKQFKCIFSQVDDADSEVENGNIKLALEYKFMYN